MNNQVSGAHDAQGDSPIKAKKTFSPRVSAILGVVSLVIGVFAGIGASAEGRHDSKLIKTGASAQGKVTNVDEKRFTTNSRKGGSKKKVTESITVNFSVPKGEFSRTATGKKTVRAKNYQPTPMNSTITVYYDVNKPSDNVIAGFEANAADGFIAGGIFFLAGGAFMYGGFTENRKRKAAKKK